MRPSGSSGPAADRNASTGPTARRGAPPSSMRLGTDVVRRCAFFDRHTAPHSWDVEDPLGDLIAERLVPVDSPEGGPYP